MTPSHAQNEKLFEDLTDDTDFPLEQTLLFSNRSRLLLLHLLMLRKTSIEAIRSMFS